MSPVRFAEPCLDNSHLACRHDIPDPTSISRALQVCDLTNLQAAFRRWQKLITKRTGNTASVDGKTLRGVHGEEVISHILSLFVHQTKQTIGQVGVDRKENEIPAGQRLLAQVPIAGLTIIADAIHTQQETVKVIIAGKADYLLVVKDNQRQLAATIALGLDDPATTKTMSTTVTVERGRCVTRVVTLSHDPSFMAYCAKGWRGLQGVGRIHRSGVRMHKGQAHPFDETVYFITSRDDLTVAELAQLIQRHWQVVYDFSV